MIIYSWNVNGIRASIKKGALQKLIKDCQPDILCLQETKAKQGQAEIDLPNYFEYWNDATKPGYSGTALFCKIKPISVLNSHSDKIIKKYNLTTDRYGNPLEEGRIISAEFDKFWIVNVYVPNGKEDLSRIPLRYKAWDPALLDHIKELEETKPVIICGDFNVAHHEIDVANPKTKKGKHGFTEEERAGFEAFCKNGFIDSFRLKHPDQTAAYTWWAQWGGARNRNVGWRIDYALVSKKLVKKIKKAEIHPSIMGSDHCPISLELEI